MSGEREVNAAFDEVVGSATRSRSALEPVADPYVRLTATAKDFGIAQRDAARATELASKAARLSGGSNEAQRAGLGQFAQALGSGTFAGEELKSVKEGQLTT